MAIMTEEQMRAIYRAAGEPMKFVRREGGEGPIVAMWENFSPDATEILPASDAEVIAFDPMG